MAEEMPMQLYGVWKKAPDWTQWQGSSEMYRTLEEAQEAARSFTRDHCREAVVYRAYPVSRFTHSEPKCHPMYSAPSEYGLAG
jgi:hypothetical protein